MILEKLINTNLMYTSIIGGLLAEYDLAHAGASAIYELKGEDVYNYLMKLDKKTRNIKIGLMMKAEEGLAESVNVLMLKYLNRFISENKLKNKDIVYTTRDSILVYNKIPTKLQMDHLEFVNKDGMYSSMFRIKNYTILFDSMTGKVDIKGISDDIVKESPFINKFLINYLYTIESCQKNGDKKIFNTLKYMRENYLKSENNQIYQDILNCNRLGIRYNNELLYIDINDENYKEESEDFSIAKDINYVNFILPIMRSVMING